MYLANPGGTVQALDGATGTLLWEYRHKGADERPSTAAVKGLSLYDDKVFVNTFDARLIALNMATGAVVWNAQVADPKAGFTFNTASLIARRKVISGLMGCNRPGPEKCAITAHDPATGRELWRTYTIPRPADPGGDTWGNMPFESRVGTGMWIGGSYDPDLNLIYWSTSQAKPWARAQRGTDADALYSNSTLALNPDTGKIVWHYQHIPGESHDMDEVFEPLLIDVGTRKSVFKMGKLGILWELDRRTGKFVRATDFGYQNLLKVDPETGTVTYLPERVQALNTPFEMCPSIQGVRSWPAMAYSPQTRALYAPILRSCLTLTFRGGEGRGGAGDFTPSHHPKSGGKLGALVAMDTNGRILWQHEKRAPFTTAALTTAGGLVFAGDYDRYFQAFDASSGKVLWKTRTPTSPQGFPISYSVGGRQFVAVPVGNTSLMFITADPAVLTPEITPPRAGNALMVFALPQ